MAALATILLAGWMLLGTAAATFCQTAGNPDVEAYVARHAPLALQEMRRTGVPASIKLAQGILETQAGKSDLVKRSNNHFGLKCKSWWTGDTVLHDDDLHAECFRKYPSVEDSYRDHSDHLRSQARYAFLFSYDSTDYRSWALGLKKAGYATNPRYPESLIGLIEAYRLDRIAETAAGQLIAEPSPPAGQAEIPTVTDNREQAPAAVAHPEGEFQINGTRAMMGRAGTSLLSIAERTGIRLGLLLDFNDLPPTAEALDRDQPIFLQRKRRQGEGDLHTVGKGETPHSISQSEGMRLDSLLEYNGLRAHSLLRPGMPLRLRPEAALPTSKPEGSKKHNPGR